MPKFHSFPNYEPYMKRVSEMSDEQMLKVIEDSIIGDGSISKCATSVNYRYMLTRTEARRDNLFTMAAIAEFVTPGVNIQYRAAQNRLSPTGVPIRSKPTWSFETPTNKIYTYMRELFYDNGRKVVPDTYLDTFDIQSAASLYIDDGSYHKTSKNVRVYVNGFYLEDVQKLQAAYTKATNLPWSIHAVTKEDGWTGYRKIDGGRMYTLFLSRSHTPDFFAMIEEHVSESYAYKIGKEYVDKHLYEKVALDEFIRSEKESKLP